MNFGSPSLLGLLLFEDAIYHIFADSQSRSDFFGQFFVVSFFSLSAVFTWWSQWY